ncbi:Lrp/AsnC family transcriptional regulator [Actinomadura livida]|uniref:Lrp/AsnC family leucine-responsive transcriptional regulator n=1 Tax=Actinomadura livida TaxID=79909 RepID=A0A7W7MVM5_9ACTN|nr:MULTISPECIES: Lrp/AsnC family transcriptional regulator [Actinomadura]MBB4772025.1 Lrp/AsnC family leucine-responsive transcriptional regulator [Actinomadura catellatispora]GGU04154.1 AsnC family transcriptional regulator [Actinomadura livida]
MANRRSRPGRAFESKELDDIDLRILAELQRNARTSHAELGRRVGLSAPAVAERIQRMESTGVIVGYHATVDPRALGFPISVLVRVRPALRELHLIPKIADEIPQIVECHRITGDDCFFFIAHLRSVDELEPILDRFTPHGRTTTSILQSAPVPRRPLPCGPSDAGPEHVLP